MTIKVIDLLNKITNNEKLPTKIRYYGVDFKLDKNSMQYYIADGNITFYEYIGDLLFTHLNAIIEILPEEKDDTYYMTD